MQKRTFPASRRIRSITPGLTGAVLAFALLAFSAPVASASDGTAAQRIDRGRHAQQRVAMPANTRTVAHTNAGFRGVAAQRSNSRHRGHHGRHYSRGHDRRVHGHAQSYGHTRGYGHFGRGHKTYTRRGHHGGIRFGFGSRIRIGLPDLSVSIGTGHYSHGFRHYNRTYSHVFPKTYVRSYTHYGHNSYGHKKYGHKSYGHKGYFKVPKGLNSFKRGQRNHYGERIYTSPRTERLRRQHYGHHGSHHGSHRGGVRTHSLNPYRR